MPIHTSWKSQAKGMGKTYKGPTTCRKFTDGSQVCISKKAWNVFYATIKKLGGKPESPRPHKINETVFNETAHKVVEEFIRWATVREVKNHE